MNDRSATTRSTCPPMSAGVRCRTLVRSSTRTRASVRSRQSSCPYPTSTATTSSAPRLSSTSVNPPVDAPASRQRRPATVRPDGSNASSAPSSLCAPRDAQRRSPSSATRTVSSRSTAVAGLAAGTPRTVTRPGRDQLGRLLARTGQPAAHELGVQADAGRHQSHLVDRGLDELTMTGPRPARCAAPRRRPRARRRAAGPGRRAARARPRSAARAPGRRARLGGGMGSERSRSSRAPS